MNMHDKVADALVQGAGVEAGKRVASIASKKGLQQHNTHWGYIEQSVRRNLAPSRDRPAQDSEAGPVDASDPGAF